uniref:hypothetical protein n=1 Tax=Acinetobacter sp. Res13-Abat-PEC07-P2-02 TaxID=2777947 RepID=UPI001A930645
KKPKSRLSSSLDSPKTKLIARFYSLKISFTYLFIVYEGEIYDAAKLDFSVIIKIQTIISIFIL